jgi:hypothetical protein
MVSQQWTIAQTSEAVAEVRSLKAPRGYEKLFSLSKLQLMLADGEKVSVRTPWHFVVQRGTSWCNVRTNG